jgi:hypothetical protein
MKRWVLVSSVVLIALAVAQSVLAVDFQQSASALDWMRAAQEPDGGFSSGFAEGSDFGSTVEVILAAVAAGEDVSTWVTVEGMSPLDFVASEIAAGTVTDAGNLSKALLVATATGQDPYAFGGRDLVALVTASQDPDRGWYGDTLFKHAYAVLALTGAGVPVDRQTVEVMTSQFTEDGGWALFGGVTPGTADTNTTALVMQALVAVGEVDAAAGALPYLRRMQNDDGGFPYQKPSDWGTDTDANSTAVVLQALYALDEPLGGWAASGTDPLGALLALWDEDSGGFYWQAAVPFPNMLATAQAVQAAEGVALSSLPRVGASRAAQAPTVGGAAPLLPESGVDLWHGSALLMLGVVALVGLSAFLRRK